MKNISIHVKLISEHNFNIISWWVNVCYVEGFKFYEIQKKIEDLGLLTSSGCCNIFNHVLDKIAGKF